MNSPNNISDSENAENANHPVSENSNNNGFEIQNQNEIIHTLSDLPKESTSAVSSSKLQSPLEALRKLRHEASTQATLPESMLLSTTTSLPRSLQIITSLTSAGSASQREVLTVNTDYASGSSGACSLLLGVIEQTNQSHFKVESREQNIGTSVQIATSELSDFPPPRDSIHRRNRFIQRSRNRRWISKCCNSPNLSDTDGDSDNQPYSRGPPPSYSSIYRPAGNHPLLTVFSVDNQSSFETPIPPPSYAQAEGILMTSYSVDNLISITSSSRRFSSSQSTAEFCPRCATLVLTVVDVHRSRDTTIMAFVLCIFGCWPCCMIPYYVDSCQTVYHYCPICRTHLGTYTPW